jgi:hypothetical protein
VVLTTASNSYDMNLTTEIVRNFAEEITIGSRCNFITIICSFSAEEVTH